MAFERQHNWLRESNRRTRCSQCRLLAQAKSSQADGRPYTYWTWGPMQWDSRSDPTPACPPVGGR